MARSVKPKPTKPLPIEPLDPGLSPFTGLTRETWRNIAYGLLENVLQYSDGLSRPLQLPPSPAAGYPRLSATGRDLLVQEAYVEAVARTMLLAAALLVREPDLEVSGRRVADYYREMLVRGVTPDDPASFGPPPTTRFNQRTVEAGLMTIALQHAPKALWEVLPPADRARVLDWFELFRHVPLHDTNWHWFAVLIGTFLKVNGRPVDDAIVEHHLRRVLTMHAGGGWFRDGASLDFYSAWAMQVFPIVWAGWADGAHPRLRDTFYQHHDEFLQTYPHVFSRQGFMPAWGRSQCYRFAASTPLSVAFLRPDEPAIDPGFARRLASGNLLQFVGQPEVLERGLLTLGFYGEDGKVTDRYSCVASPYWASMAFLPLALPESHSFWSSTENEGFWADPPASVALGETGMWVEHDGPSGRTRLYAPQKARWSDRRYNQVCFEAP